MLARKILVVDDEPDILTLIKESLSKEGFNVTTARNADLAIKAAKEKKPDLVVLDLELGGISGWEVCKLLKADTTTQDIPIIIITAKHVNTEDIVKGLDIGADDYVTKPFKLNILVARINAILRRKGQVEKPQSTIESGNVKINLEEYQVYVNNKRIIFTPKEFNLLSLLVKKKGRVLNRAYLMENVWGYEYFGTTRTVDKHIENIRKKLGKEGRRIETVEGVGYRFVDKETTEEKEEE
jgi:two-component system, OmpR family, alkaline phosphatase synthesis response regulator PhoP